MNEKLVLVVYGDGRTASLYGSDAELWANGVLDMEQFCLKNGGPSVSELFRTKKVEWRIE